MYYKKIDCSFFLIILLNKISVSQDMRELFDLHYENLKKLKRERGMTIDTSTSWGAGIISNTEVTQVLNRYEYNKVGLLVYTFTNDTLRIDLFKPSGNIITVKQHWVKEDLINEINNANLFVSNNGSPVSAKNRGVIPLHDNSKKGAYQKSFEKINTQLIPFPDSLKNTHTFKIKFIVAPFFLLLSDLAWPYPIL
jgi:hypothetical protein